ncbi:hypothetical protein Acor_55230 [Acrocarpospora corrugata]|uniref:Uncharacterized protein n=1 Tax=Acrocarpospora corrugata TaxID=35763 RepID=A0A5M3W309_9ACTN|nr:hypothetical protein Acor_55230 [Acrocarpospora corrugata]
MTIMTIVQTTAASIGRLGLAAAVFGRPVFARADEPPGATVTPAETATGARLSMSASLYELLVNAAIATGWLSERRTLLGRSLDKDAKVMVTVKDVLVAGTVLTGAAALVGKAVTRREPPADGSASGEEPSPDAAVDADSSHRYLQKVTKLNRTFALLGVASAFINLRCSTPTIPTRYGASSRSGERDDAYAFRRSRQHAGRHAAAGRFCGCVRGGGAVPDARGIGPVSAPSRPQASAVRSPWPPAP